MATLRIDSVAHGPDLDRVLRLPERIDPTEEQIEALSAHFRVREWGTDPTTGEPRRNELRAGQAAAIMAMLQVGGLLAPMPVGAGKTLVSLLLPTALDSHRPVLILPADQVERTTDDYALYRQDWRVRLPEIRTYETLGHPKHEGDLYEICPDLITLDEAQKARNVDAGCTRRIHRYIHNPPPCRWCSGPTIPPCRACQGTGRLIVRVAVLSGSLITPDLMDYQHQSVWALGARSPTPILPEDAKRWAAALDRNLGPLDRIAPGALTKIPGGFHHHLRTRQGVVPLSGDDCKAAIHITTWEPPMDPKLRAVIDQTAESRMRPDGELIDNDFELPEVLNQLSKGLYLVWDPLPPRWWLLPRRAWYAYARAVLEEHLPGFDTFSQVATALDAAHPQYAPPAAHEGRQLLAEWRAVADHFTPNTVPVWLDYSIVAMAAAKARAEPGWLVWTDIVAVGEMLARYGLPYYGGGTNPERHPTPGESLALSWQSHQHGKNLQAWGQLLYLCHPTRAEPWQQSIGRVHRPRQRRPSIWIEIQSTIDYHADVIDRARGDAVATKDRSGLPHKFVDCTWHPPGTPRILEP